VVKQIPKIRIKRFLLIFLLVILVAALALFLLARENLYDILRALQSANYSLVLAALAIYVGSTIVWALRWRVTLSAAGHKVRIRDLFLTIYGGIFINNVTPFTYSGGDPIGRSYLLSKTQKVPFASSFATIITEFVLDVPVYFSFITFGVTMALGLAPVLAVLASIIIVVLLEIVLLSIFSQAMRNKFASKRVGGFVMRLIKRIRKGTKTRRITGGISRFYTDAQTIISRRTIVVTVILFSVTLWTISVLRLFIIFQALGYTPSISMITLATTVPWIVGLLPLLPGGMGTVDVALVSVFLIFGAPRDLALSAALIERAISFVFSTIAGAGALSYLTSKVLAR
jgi:uncharacterized protein (TIRG00374 family)